jgi:hypothetical protein
MTAQRYMQEVLQSVTISFAFGHEGVDVLPWPPSVPDLSPIPYGINTRRGATHY